MSSYTAAFQCEHLACTAALSRFAPNIFNYLQVLCGILWLPQQVEGRRLLAALDITEQKMNLMHSIAISQTAAQRRARENYRDTLQLRGIFQSRR